MLSRNEREEMEKQLEQDEYDRKFPSGVCVICRKPQGKHYGLECPLRKESGIIYMLQHDNPAPKIQEYEVINEEHFKAVLRGVLAIANEDDTFNDVAFGYFDGLWYHAVSDGEYGALKVMPHDISYIVRLREKIQVDLQQYGWKKSKTINNWHKYTKRFFLDSGVGATATYNDGKNKFSVEVAVDRVEVPGDLCQDHIDYCVSGAMDLIGQMERDLNIQAGLLEIKSKGHFAFRLPVWLWRWLWR